MKEPSKKVGPNYLLRFFVVISLVLAIYIGHHQLYQLFGGKMEAQALTVERNFPYTLSSSYARQEMQIRKDLTKCLYKAVGTRSEADIEVCGEWLIRRYASFNKLPMAELTERLYEMNGLYIGNTLKQKFPGI